MTCERDSYLTSIVIAAGRKINAWPSSNCAIDSCGIVRSVIRRRAIISNIDSINSSCTEAASQVEEDRENYESFVHAAKSICPRYGRQEFLNSKPFFACRRLSKGEMVNTDGHENNAIGNEAPYNNVSGSGNTAIGDGALYSDAIGSANSALGVNAGSNLTTGDNNIDIGNRGVAGASNTIRIGDASIHTALYIGVFTPGGGYTVTFNAVTGRLGTQVYSARFKDDIQPIDGPAKHPGTPTGHLPL